MRSFMFDILQGDMTRSKVILTFTCLKMYIARSGDTSGSRTTLFKISDGFSFVNFSAMNLQNRTQNIYCKGLTYQFTKEKPSEINRVHDHASATSVGGSAVASCCNRSSIHCSRMIGLTSCFKLRIARESRDKFF